MEGGGDEGGALEKSSRKKEKNGFRAEASRSMGRKKNATNEKGKKNVGMAEVGGSCSFKKRLQVSTDRKEDVACLLLPPEENCLLMLFFAEGSL